ncbi:hypothetical protein [Paraflavitalea sp. CAU 1676]|uniref:LVIVD repeat-containing protein n=1 Tax=Paraflavitalea sp. CAU 1676 TaxID=3032598 RepID=UPI0023DC0BE0|nr:hypothetical protein [Paraflavitalea sp. CAU 1676]MDF2189955.1 hypothetical protein [Paraflavitalea sp. CAU 1676]
MTWINQRLLLWVVCAISIVSMNGCLKDNCTRTYSIYLPVYKTLTEVRAAMKSGTSRTVKEPGKLYIYGNYIFLNEQQKGIHVIDNSNPAAPRNISFIDIAGNVDLAVKGNTLYADSWSDLVTLDISDPKDVKLKNILNNVFPHRNRYYYQYNPANVNPDSLKVIVDWIKKDTSVDCESYRILYESFYSLASADRAGNYASPNFGGMGGSMARFTLMNNYLYTVTNSTLNTFSISTPQQPSLVAKKELNNWNIETIYPFRDKLFIGSSSGMYIFNVNNPSAPEQLGTFSHVRSCDPVVADEDYAYVTLRSGTACQGFTNQLEILNVQQPTSPSLVKTYPMTNPHGLSKDNNLLFICDGKDGVKVYDASNVNDLKQINHIGGFESYDVIAYNKHAIVVAQDGLYQYNYADVKNIKLLSKIKIAKD